MVSNFKNMVLSLSLIAVFAAVTLATVYSLTKEPIELSKKAKLQNAISEVLPTHERIVDAERVGLTNGDTLNVFKAYDKADKFVGAAVETFSRSGYSGDIRLMVGFDVKGNIVNYSVLEQKETPGLGTKIVDWFKTEIRNQNIIGKNPSNNKLTVTKDGGEVDAITAATISSRAFLEAVQKAYNAYEGNTDAASGATKTENSVENDNQTNEDGL